MALPTASPALPASPQVIGNAFIQQYYQILHQHPEQVHKFYQDSSILSRPDTDGRMASVTTIQAINDKILSWDFSNCFTEIETVDSQPSYKEGVLIVVTGSFTANDSVRRKFTQSFFLAPQDNGGFFVLNDVFRLLNEVQPINMSHLLVNGTSYDAPKATLTPEIEPKSLENHVDEAPVSEGDADNVDEVIDPIENASSGVEDEAVVSAPEHVSQNNVTPVPEPVSSLVQDDAPRKSYASILKVPNGTTPSKTHVRSPAVVKAKVPPPPEKTVIAPKVPSADGAIVTNDNGVSENNSHEEEGFSVYIKNLPVDATAEQVEQEFKKFGTIKPGGVQVRNHKIDKFCFGFVEFESAQSMHAAIEASPVEIRGYTAHVEQKRTSTRVVNGVVTYSANGNGGRGRFQPGGRGGFRNENFRGRGNFGSNMGFRRNDFRNRVDYNGHGRGRGYQQRVYQNGNGRASQRPIGTNGGPKLTAAVA